MKNRSIWLTGASSGIGQALANELSQSNQLLLSCRNTQNLNPISHPLSLDLDLDQLESLEDKAKEALKLLPQLDTVIWNAGISQRDLASQTHWSVDQRLMNVNYLSYVILTKALLPHLLKQQGHIVIISSLVGKFASPYRSGYAGSKHALHGFFDSLRAEHAQSNLNISILCPGFVRTNISKNALIGKGEQLGIMDEAQAKAMSPKEFAQKAIRAIEKNKAEAYIGGKEVLGIYIQRYFPSVFRKLISKAKVR